MSAMLLCRACDRYQQGRDAIKPCEFCGSDDVWLEQDPGDEEDGP